MFELMHIFAAVVEQGSLNKAAQILNLTQPALSRKIMKLEQQLGVVLFERRGKRLELTRIGRISYEAAIDMRNLQKKFENTLMEYKAFGNSSITIGASLTTLQSTLPDLITLFTKENPGTDIKAVTGKTHEIVTLVKDRLVDIGLVASKVDHPGLNCVPLFDDHLSFVCPNNTIMNAESSIEINRLNGLPMILFSKGTWYRILMDDLFRRYAITPNIKMEIDSFEAIIRLVSTCEVATLLPKSYLRHSVIEDNNLVIVEINELKQTTRTTSLIFGDVHSLNASTKQLIERAKVFYPYKAGSLS